MSGRRPEVEAVENGDGSIDVTIKIKGACMKHDGRGRFEMATYRGPAGFLVPFREQQMSAQLVVKLWADYSPNRAKRRRFSLALNQRPESGLVIA